jgi:DNA-binding PadR family transcriptional regulator
MSIRHALLALLSDQPTFGLRLRQEFEARTGEVWPLNVGQVYSTLQRLERDGLVASDGEGDGPQKRYHLTPEGRTELHTWLHTPSIDSQPPRDELVIKVLVAVQVPDISVHDVIQVHRRQLIEQMQQYTSVKADADAADVALALVVDAEIFRIEGAVRWLDSAEARLRHTPLTAPALPAPAPVNTVVDAARRSTRRRTTTS